MFVFTAQKKTEAVCAWSLPFGNKMEI